MREKSQTRAWPVEKGEGHSKWRDLSIFIHSFITKFYIAPLQGYYSGALPTTYESGWSVLSIAVSYCHRQCTVSVLIIAKLTMGYCNRWNRILETVCPVGYLNLRPVG